MLDGLSQHSRLLRFFTGGANLREAAALAATAPGVVALAGDPEHVVGHALYVRDRPGSAEVAFEVAQSWHGRGVGTVLLGAVAQRAAAEGIETLTAIVMPENHAMIDVFRHSGFPVVRPCEPRRAPGRARHQGRPGRPPPVRGAGARRGGGGDRALHGPGVDRDHRRQRAPRLGRRRRGREPPRELRRTAAPRRPRAVRARRAGSRRAGGGRRARRGRGAGGARLRRQARRRRCWSSPPASRTPPDGSGASASPRSAAPPECGSSAPTAWASPGRT